MGFSKETCERIVSTAVDAAIDAAVEPLLVRIAALEQKLKVQQRSHQQLELRVNLLDRRNDDGEQYTQRLNLILDGVRMYRDETPEDIRDTILREVDRLEIEIDDLEVDRAHRIDLPYRDQRGYLQQPVIVRFISWGARNTFYQARKWSRFRMRPHLTARRENVLDDAREKIRVYDHVRDAIQFVFADKNCKMQAKCLDGRILGFSTKTEFDSLVSYIHGTIHKSVIPEIAMKYDRTGYTIDDKTWSVINTPLPNSPLVIIAPSSPSTTNISYASAASPASPTKPIIVDAVEPL